MQFSRGTLSIIFISLSLLITISLLTIPFSGCAQTPKNPVNAPTASPDFTITPETPGGSIPVGQFSMYFIFINRINGFTDPVHLTVENSIIGQGTNLVDTSFAENPVISDTSLLVISVGSNVPVGSYQLIIKGRAGSLEKQVTFNLIVTAPVFPWTEQRREGPPLRNVYFIDPDNGFVISDFAKILKTTNGGTTWLELNTGIMDVFMDVQFLNLSSGYIVGLHSLLYTSTAGATWTKIQSLDTLAGTYLSLYFKNSSKGWIAGNQVYYTNNGGNSWTIQVPLEGGDLLWDDIEFGTLTNGVVVGSKQGRKRIKYTNDGGNSWIESNYPAGSINSGRMCFATSTTVYATFGDRVLKSVDSGVNWNEIDTIFNVSLRGISFADENTGLITSFERIYLTTDGGVNWVTDYNFIGAVFINVFFVNTQTAFAVGEFPPVGIIYRRN